MEIKAVEIIETETVLEEIMSLNHSRLTYRLCILLSKYEQRYDILPELELELSSGRAKPDVSIFENLIFNWEEDVIRYPKPPVTAIEVLSPTQAFDELTSKIRKIYFPGGVRSAWIMVPSIQAIHLFLPEQAVITFTEGKIIDPVSQIELTISDVFR